MRAITTCAAVLSVLAGLYASALSVAASPAKPPLKQYDVTIRASSILVEKGALAESQRAEVKELLEKGQVTGENVQRLRVMVAALIQNGKAVAVDSVTKTALLGEAPRIALRGPGKDGTLAGSVQPRLANGQLMATFDLVRGKPADRSGDGQVLRTTVALPEDGRAALWLDAPREVPTELILLLQFTRE